MKLRQSFRIHVPAPAGTCGGLPVVHGLLLPCRVGGEAAHVDTPAKVTKLSVEPWEVRQS